MFQRFTVRTRFVHVLFYKCTFVLGKSAPMPRTQAAGHPLLVTNTTAPKFFDFHLVRVVHLHKQPFDFHLVRVVHLCFACVSLVHLFPTKFFPKIL